MITHNTEPEICAKEMLNLDLATTPLDRDHEEQFREIVTTMTNLDQDGVEAAWEIYYTELMAYDKGVYRIGPDVAV